VPTERELLIEAMARTAVEWTELGMGEEAVEAWLSMMEQRWLVPDPSVVDWVKARKERLALS
jgi:hypothetical protein